MWVSLMIGYLYNRIKYTKEFLCLKYNKLIRATLLKHNECVYIYLKIVTQ